MEETFERVTERHGAPAGAAARFRPGRAADRSELMNDNLVVDTSVLLDILLTNRPRHAKAVRLVPLLKNRTVHLPMHGMFELSSGLSSEKRKRGILPYKLLISENNPLTVKLIAIDEAFVQKYMTRDIARV
jgi:hypothetical protein